jgi:hypothetical protein
MDGCFAYQQPPVADRPTKDIFKHDAPDGIGEQGARAAKRKYYLTEEVRYERLTKGGDFILSRGSAPLSVYEPHARNFALCLDTLLGD